MHHELRQYQVLYIYTFRLSCLYSWNERFTFTCSIKILAYPSTFLVKKGNLQPWSSGTAVGIMMLGRKSKILQVLLGGGQTRLLQVREYYQRPTGINRCDRPAGCCHASWQLAQSVT